MADLDLVVVGGQVRLEAVVLDHQLGSCQEGHDCALADTSVTNDDDGLLVFFVDGYGLQSLVDQLLQHGQIYGVGFTVHHSR